MVKHAQTIRRQQPTTCLSVFDHFVGLMLIGLTAVFLQNAFGRLLLNLLELHFCHLSADSQLIKKITTISINTVLLCVLLTINKYTITYSKAFIADFKHVLEAEWLRHILDPSRNLFLIHPRLKNC